MYIYLYFCVFSINQQNYHLIIKLKTFFFFRCIADPDKDRVLKKTITIKRRTLKPYEKKFRHQGEYQYDLPIQSGIPEGHPKVCYDRSSKVNQRGNFAINAVDLISI